MTLALPLRSRPSRPLPTSTLLLLSLLILLCAIPPRVAAHIQLSNPIPINAPKNPHTTWQTADYDYTSPLLPDGSNFPCKGYHLTSPQSIATYKAGETYTATLAGSATHTGGSCQFALSYDKGRTFRVIKSVVGGCPVKQDYEFVIPTSAPGGEDVLFAWTWVNREGNREFYMDCAWVTIEGSDSSSSSSDGDENEGAFEDLPEIYVANIASVNDCKTEERKDVVFAPEIQGPDVEYGGGLDEGSTPTAGEECTWHGERAEGEMVASQSYKSAQKGQMDHGDMDHDDMEGHDHGDDDDDGDGDDHEMSDLKPAGARAGIFASDAAPASNPASYDEKLPAFDTVLDKSSPDKVSVVSSGERIPYDGRMPMLFGAGPRPSSSAGPIKRPGGQPRPIAIGEPHPIALAGYDLYYDHDHDWTPPDRPPPPPAGGEGDTTVTVDVTEACPTDDPVYVTVTASCTSLPDVTVTVIASTITVRPSKSASIKKTVTLRRSTIYSVISLPPASASAKPTSNSKALPNSSWRTSARPSPPPTNPGGENNGNNGANDLAFATDPSKYMPCTPGAFLCTSPTEFLTCDQWGDGREHGWMWLYPRAVAGGMECKPHLVGGRRGDLYVSEGA